MRPVSDIWIPNSAGLAPINIFTFQIQRTLFIDFLRMPDPALASIDKPDLSPGVILVLDIVGWLQGVGNSVSFENPEFVDIFAIQRVQNCASAIFLLGSAASDVFNIICLALICTKFV